MDVIRFHCGRFSAQVALNCPQTATLIQQQYAPITDPEQAVDFVAELRLSGGARRFFRRQARFFCHGVEPFAPMPASQAYPLLEWGMNWAVTQHFHEALVIHSAVVSKDEITLILPGLPGAGKSTLCASLVYGAGWKLLSDEMTLYVKDSHQILPNPRPVSLKNQSIALIEQHFPVTMTPQVRDTVKGTVAHTQLSISQCQPIAQAPAPTHIIFPQYDSSLAHNEVRIAPMPAADCFFKVADNSFNYSVLGVDGFDSVKQLIQRCGLYSLHYGGNFAAVASALEELGGKPHAVV